MEPRRFNNTGSEFEEKVIEVRRVSKKTKGGNRIGFSVLVVVGDKKGRVGIGVGRAPDVVSGIRKGITSAKKHMIEVPILGTTVPFEIRYKFGAARILVKPARGGSGIVAGGPLRAVLEVAGVRDVVGKMLGSNNKIANVYAATRALEKMGEIWRLRGGKGTKNG